MRSGTLRVAGVAVVLSLCALIGGVGVAGAGKVTKIKSIVKIRSSDPTAFKGIVKSKREKCRKGRKVRLFRFDDSGYAESGTKEKVGSDRTSKKGKWVVKPPAGTSFIAGKYQAKVAAKKIRAKGSAVASGRARVKCRAASVKGTL